VWRRRGVALVQAISMRRVLILGLGATVGVAGISGFVFLAADILLPRDDRRVRAARGTRPRPDDLRRCRGLHRDGVAVGADAGRGNDGVDLHAALGRDPVTTPREAGGASKLEAFEEGRHAGMERTPVAAAKPGLGALRQDGMASRSVDGARARTHDGGGGRRPCGSRVSRHASGAGFSAAT